MIPPQKHVVDSGPVSVTSTIQTKFQIAHGVLNPDYNSNQASVRVGSLVRGVLIQLEVALDNATISSSGNPPIYFDWFIMFNVDDAQSPPTAGNVGQSDLLVQVFHQDGCLIPTPTAVAATIPPITRVWQTFVSLPPSWSKFMRGDALNLYFKADQALKYWTKIRAIYKEIFP